MEKMIIECIKKSFNNITQDYFLLETTYGEIKRERVFCYELYHQMRSSWCDNTSIKIHGEIDKSGHRSFNREHRKNPDFVFHIPGEFDNNRVIVEVKGLLDSNGIRKDIETLTTFIERYRYRKGVYLIFNYSLNEMRNELLRNRMLNIPPKILENIIIICKKRADMPMEEVELSTIFNL